MVCTVQGVFVLSFNHLAISSLYLTDLVSSLLLWLSLITSFFHEIALKYVPCTSVYKFDVNVVMALMSFNEMIYIYRVAPKGGGE